MAGRLRTLVIVATAAALVAGGCGSSAGSHPTRAGARFALLRVATDPGLDYLDPGLSYTAEGWIPMFGVYLTLLGYRQAPGAAGAELVPVLARALPQVSADGLTYRLRLRSGLRYSDGSPVRAGDFAWTVRRLVLLDSPGVGFFDDVAGLSSFERTRHGPIPGIRTDDRTGAIEIRLVHPKADFANVLAALFAAPVPRGTPPVDRSLHPAPGTGPYRITSYRPGREFTLDRNPFFRPVGGIAAGNPDRLRFVIVGDPAIALRRTLGGEYDWDAEQIPPDRLASLGGVRARLRIGASPNTYFFFLNTRTPPFDRLEVRRAVNYAVDRQALLRIAGGLGRPTQNVLPPSYPQFRPLRLYPRDLAKARALVAKADARGTRVDVWGPAGSPATQEVEYVADVLSAIGLDAHPKILAPAVYFTAVASRRTHAQIGWTNWFADYPHPSDWFDALFDGSRITPEHNTNLSNADLPELNHAIRRLDAETSRSPAVDARWAAVDRMVMEQALVVPFMNGVQTELFGPRVDMRCYAYHDALYQVLWARTCVRS